MRTIFILLVAGWVSMAPAQVNSWTKPTSGSWEEQAYWSLGVLPDSTQSVMFTNSGWKAVAIGPNTAQNFPASMQIQDLRIESPQDSFNELLMNFSGFAVPLQMTSLSVVGTNSAFVMQSSRLEVTDTNPNSGNVFVGGTISQGDFSQVKVSGFMSIGRFNENAAYYLTNGSLSIINVLEVGGGLSRPAKFVQYGGSNTEGALNVNNEGEYDLYGGDVIANGISVGGGDYANTSSFYQYGGTVTADMVVNGSYTLNGGTITGRFTVGAPGNRTEYANVMQNGGTNSAISMDLGHPGRYGISAYYTLSNGVVRVNSSTTFGGGSFSQYSGTHTIVSNFVMHGTDTGLGTVGADYFLYGGMISMSNLTEEAAWFFQSAGTNLIAGGLVLSLTPPWQVTGYGLRGGTLAVKDIEIDANAFFEHAGGNIIHSGVLLLNQGEWQAANGDYLLGPLQLGAPNPGAIGFHTNSAIIFPDGSSILRLANSSAQPWAPNAILYVTNWHGSASGGGATQLYFGSNSSGLTIGQLARTTFSNPGGYPPGNYGAQLLSTGELVPVAQPTLQSVRYGSALVLTWPTGYQLLSATNLTGPYTPVSGATSPRTNSFAKPREFFRLQGL